RQGRIELAGAVPDLEVGLLHHLVREVCTPQDTQYDAVQFRPRRRVQPLEGGAVALRDRGQQPDKLLRTQHVVGRPTSRRRLSPQPVASVESARCRSGHGNTTWMLPRVVDYL